MVEGEEWYLQGATAIPWFIHVPYKGASELIGRDMIVYYKGEDNRGYFNKKTELEGARGILENQKADGSYLNNAFYSEWKKRQEKLESEFADFSALDEKELLNKAREIAELLGEVWKKAAAIELFDPCGEKLLKEEMGRHNLALTSEELNALTPPLNPRLPKRKE